MADVTLDTLSARGAVLATDIIPILNSGGTTLLKAAASDIATYVLTGNAASATTAASCSGNAATATTSAACSGNAATATSAASATTATSAASATSAATATALATGRTISLTGDGTATTGTFDGTAAVSGALTLATVNGNVGTFANATVTVNAKGLVTAASAGSSALSYAQFRNQQNNGVGSGETIASATWTARTLNTTVTNTIGGASLAANQVTLPAGTYSFTAYAQFKNAAAGGAFLRLRNTTDATTTAIGPVAITTAAGDLIQNLQGTFVLAGSKVMELDAYTTSTGSSTGGSLYSPGTELQVYVDLQFLKIA